MIPKIPKRVKKAIKIISGYCNKHSRCNDCPLKFFCGDGKYMSICDWGEYIDIRKEEGED